MTRISQMLVLAGTLLGPGLVHAEQTPREAQISLSGTWKIRTGQFAPANLYQSAVDDSSWGEIKVPGNWYLEGQDLSGDVWMRRHFLGPVPRKDQVVQLTFEGVDYSTDVWLNDEYLGFHEGYFEPFRFDVSSILRPQGDNVLVVLVHSPNEEYGKSWSLHKRLIKGIFNHHDTRPGGAWSPRGQEQNTGGIWAPVYLRTSNGVAITALRASPVPEVKRSKGSGTGRWNLGIQLTIWNPGSTTRTVQIESSLVPENFTSSLPSGGQSSLKVQLKPGENKISTKVRSENTRLWWTWDQGEPNLYHLQLEVLGAEEVLDQASESIGFRTVKVAANSDEWQLNGRRIFLRGTNYISSQWMSEMTMDRYVFDVGLLKRANVNAVRVHAHIEARDFYTACDQAGILLWQDFPLQWGYTEDPAFEEEAVRQARAMVAFLGDHPAVAAWTMHNEPPWDASWMQYKYSDYSPTQNKQLDERLAAAVAAADPTRFVHDHSSTSEHPWLGWYSGAWQDYGKPTKEPLISEFGAQALPSLTSLRKIFKDDQLWPDSEAKWQNWNYHNFQKHEYFDLARVSMGSSIEEFIDNTQRYQAKVIQFAAESYRRQRFEPVTAIFQFMFVEDWPSINWGVVDYWRNPKPGYRALTTAYQPVLPSIVWSKETWEQGEPVVLPLWVINDLPTAYPDSQLVYTLRSEDGKLAYTQTIKTNIAADSGAQVGVLERKDLAPGAYDLSVEIEDNRHQTLGRNRFQFRIAESATQ